MESVIITQVKEHLAQGDFDSALQLLETYADSNLDSKKAGKVRNEIIYLQGQIAEVKKAEARGLIAFEQAERNRNQIRLSMINLTDAVAGDDDAHPVFTEDRPRTESPIASNNTNIYKYIVIGIAAIILFVLALELFDVGGSGTDSEPDSTEQQATTPNSGADNQGTADGPCYFKTLAEVELLNDADMDAGVISYLDAGQEFDVIQTKIQLNDDGEAEFLQVESESGLGWVLYDPSLIQLSPGCN